MHGYYTNVKTLARLSIYLTMQKFSKFLHLCKLCNDHMRHFGSVIFYVLAIYGDTLQGGGTSIDAVLRAATAVKTKVNGQAEIFSMVKSQATISF